LAQAGVALELTARWQRLASTWGAAPAVVDAVYRHVVTRYGEPHRRYHTLEHIAEVLAVVDELDGGIEVEWAAWLHDVIHDVHAVDSEARSAGYAGEVLAQLRAPEDTIKEVQRLIELSATHAVVGGDKHGAVFVEADLAILASSPDRYDRYVRDVRAEYAHVDDDGWRTGRGAVLESLLASVTDERARSNLARELATLTA
jgi:predicted metal-dependent HD superfamily phosphohydrolase